MKQLILRKRNILLLLLPLGIALTEWAKADSEVAEKVFATGIYKILSQCMAVFTGWIPFSLMELVVMIGPVVLLYYIVRQIIRTVHIKSELHENPEKAEMCAEAVTCTETAPNAAAYTETERKETAGKEKEALGKKRFFLWMTMVENLLCLAAVVFFAYVLLCGVNYHRYPVAYHFNLSVENSSMEELTELFIELADTASGLRTQLTTENENGVYELPFSKRVLGQEAKKAYEALAEQYPIFGGIYPAPKPVHFSRLMSYTEITGVFTPWTMEANVNIDISPYSIGSTMCHELAHLRGFMREDEANYISYRACMASDSVDLQYSGTMLALINTGNALYRQNADAYFEVYREHISAAVSRDLTANNAYWEQFEKPVIGETTAGEIMEKVNDTYLKANDQTDGTKSYGRVVDLLLAEYKARHGNE